MKNIPALVIGLLLFVLIGFLVERHHLQAEVRQLRLQNDHIPTFRELQQMLIDKGYKIKADGKICKMWNVPGHSETIEAWDDEICQQSAAKSDYMYEVAK